MPKSRFYERNAKRLGYEEKSILSVRKANQNIEVGNSGVSTTTVVNARTDSA